MKKYVATCKSYGFQRRLWEEGESVELPDDHKCPEYFKPVEEQEVKQEEVVPEPTTFHGINEAKKSTAPKTGMAYEAKQPKEKGKPSKKK